MRELSVTTIRDAIKELCQETNFYLNPDIKNKIIECRKKEQSPLGCEILGQLLENASIAEEKQIPMCQDTGMAVIFLQIGQEVHLVDGFLGDAIDEGVRLGYGEGFLRKSVVKDPFLRENTKDNTPAVVHTEIVRGNQVTIDFAPKGFGSENMSRIYMLKPSDGIEGAKKAVLETVLQGGGNPCPPIVVGVGCGSTFEGAALLAKKALLRPVGSHAEQPHLAEMEEELLEKINKMGIGPQGLGGNTTALAVHVESLPTHIAGMPIAINISCHATRHGRRVL